jgi:hypothetical protein
MGSPERESPFCDQCTEKIAEWIPVVHQITGEDIVSDDCPLHQGELIKGDECQQEDYEYYAPIFPIKSIHKVNVFICRNHLLGEQKGPFEDIHRSAKAFIKKSHT